MTTTAPPRARGLGLDILRGLAALGVLITHVAFVTGVVNPARVSSGAREILPRLDVGVWVFFILSGFLVSRPFVRAALDGRGSPETGPYLLRRVVRVMPLYWVVLAVTLATSSQPMPGAAQLAADTLLLHIYVPRWAIGPITQSWSLATEVSFYLFLPLWFLAMGKWFRRRGITERSDRIRWIALGLVGWAVVALVYRLAVVQFTDTFDFTQAGAADVRGALLTWLPNHLDTFAIGVAFALWLEAGRRVRVTTSLRFGCYAVSLGALVIASSGLGLPPVFTGFDGGQTLARHALFLLCAAAAIAPSALATGQAGETRTTSPAVSRLWAGVALGSYGVYLWHQWVTEHWFSWRDLQEFNAPFPTTLIVVVLASAALATITYHLIERTSLAALKSAITGPGNATPRQLGIHPALDGVRGVAIAAVLASHVVFLDSGRGTYALEGGFLGVDVFLVLSGFLIGATLLREVDRTGRVSMPDFLRRRARRLLPPLVGFLAIHTLVVAIIGDSMREELIQVVLALLFVGNWQLTFGHAPPLDLVHLWSLACEGQLYVLLGVIVSGVRNIVRARPWTVFLGLCVASVGVAFWRYANYRAGFDVIALYERTDIRADSMLIGLAVAVAWRSRLIGDDTFRWAGAIGAVALGWMMFVAKPGAGWLFEGGFTIVAVAGAALVVAATMGSGVVEVVGQWSVLRWLGRISYSLYLWHLPVFIWVVRIMPDAPVGVKIVVSITSAIVVAEIAYRLFEVRFLAGWRRGGGVPAAQQANSVTPAAADTR